MNDQLNQWKEIVATPMRHRKLITRVVIAGVVTTLALVWIQPPKYKATATLIVMSKRAEVAVSPDASTKATVDRLSEARVNSEVALLKSQTLIREVLDATGSKTDGDDEGSLIGSLVSLPFRVPGLIYRALHGLEAPTPLDMRARKVSSAIEVSPVVRSHLINVSYENRDPEWATSFVNELVSAHIARNASINEQSDTRLFFKRQRELAGENLETATAALNEFRAKSGEEVVFQDEAELRTRIAEFESLIASTETELAEVSAKAAFLGAELGTTGAQAAAASPSTVADQELALVRSRVLELELQKTELLTRYAPTSTVIRDIDKQIAQVGRLLDGKGSGAPLAAIPTAQENIGQEFVAARAQQAALEGRAEALGQQVTAYRSILAKLDDVDTERQRLENEVLTSKEAYLTYLRKEEAARFTSALDESRILNLAVAEPATVPSSPEPRPAMLAIVMGFFMSLAAGLALAFLIDWIDPTVRSAAQASKAAGIPVIGEIPS